MTRTVRRATDNGGEPASMDWRMNAACKGTDGDMWFPTSNHPIHDDQVQAAKSICRSCPVLTTCRDWAIPNLDYGIAGGLTEDERLQMRNGAPPPTPVVGATVVHVEFGGPSDSRAAA